MNKEINIGWQQLFPKENIYYQEESGIIYQGDSREILKQFPDNSIDAIITDPPYNISQKNKIFRDYRSGKRADISFDYGDWDYDFDIKPILEETKRILKKYGQWIIFCAEQQIGMYRKWLGENGHFKQIIIWEKINPLPQFRKCGYRQATEMIMWAYKEKPLKKYQHFNFLTQQEMKNIFRFPICGGKERTKHPTQKPIDLIIELLRRHSFEDDLILDPLTASAVTVNVSSTSDFPEQGRIKIDNEEILYTGRTATAFTGCTRGARGTTAISHTANSTVHNGYKVLISNYAESTPIGTDSKVKESIISLTLIEI